MEFDSTTSPFVGLAVVLVLTVDFVLIEMYLEGSSADKSSLLSSAPNSGASVPEYKRCRCP